MWWHWIKKKTFLVEDTCIYYIYWGYVILGTFAKQNLRRAYPFVQPSLLMGQRKSNQTDFLEMLYLQILIFFDAFWFCLIQKDKTDTLHEDWHIFMWEVLIMEGQTVFSVRYELKPKNQWQSEHLAVYDKSTGNMVSRPLRDKCRRRDISCFVREVLYKKNRHSLIKHCCIQRFLALTISNPIFLPTAYSPALICFGR
jgi:hypothetical protein